MQVVSALGGCVEGGNLQPAFLKFQLGPVQDFIAAARSTRDLWSGSYLLSWLMASGLKKLSEEVGPDAVIFPSLREQPLFDLHWRSDLWSRVSIGNDGKKNVWDTLDWKDDDLLTPNLPNVFLAVVPRERAEALAKTTCEAIQSEWRRIADAVWDACVKHRLTRDEEGLTEETRKRRYDAQVGSFLSLSWQCTPWPDTMTDAVRLAEDDAAEMPIVKASKRVQKIIHMATNEMPVGHRDGRFYEGGKDGPKDELNNIGLGWSVILALNGWQLDAVRQTRTFSAANEGGWNVGRGHNKDSLTGKEEAVGGGEEWVKRSGELGKPWAYLFDKTDWVGAPTLIKRVWHDAYLDKIWGIKTSDFPMPNTRGIAAHDPFKDCGDDEIAENTSSLDKYFAVIAFDGDEIGKWVSGEKTPEFKDQLADYKDPEQVRQGTVKYFEQEKCLKEFLATQRPLSPSYHLQFSEALGHFALRCARPIVEVFDGRLIYAGGDDVLAMVPAATALACAYALRKAFRGETDIGDFLEAHAKKLRDVKRENHPSRYQGMAAKKELLQGTGPGFLARWDSKDDQEHPILFVVPGPKADASVGIAIAHFKAPLQDVVREAQAAEKQAKSKCKEGGQGRSAFAVTLMKRSGEVHHWGGKWGDDKIEAGGLCLYNKILDLLERKTISAKFPHRLVEVIEPYLSTDSGNSHVLQGAETFSEEIARKILLREVEWVADRQRGPNYTHEIVEELNFEAQRYLELVSSGLRDSCKTQCEKARAETPLKHKAPQKMVSALIGLCQTVAFAHRTRAETVER